MTDFNYKKYSLGNLENWIYDSMSASEATPQEIYDVIKGVVEENYYTYKHQTSQAYELLALLNGKGHITPPTKEVKDDSWGHSDMEALRYTDKEMDLMCDNASKQDKVVKWQLPIEADSSGEYFITFPDDLLQAANLKENDEVEWVEQEVGTFLLRKIPKNYKEMIEAGYTMTADGFWIKE
jgi:hypothetical protein